MNTCKSCKYYLADQGSGEYENVGYCFHDKTGEISTPPPNTRNDMVWLVAPRARHAHIAMGPDFGCIHHCESSDAE
jgi:hypothetical protein